MIFILLQHFLGITDSNVWGSSMQKNSDSTKVLIFFNKIYGKICMYIFERGTKMAKHFTVYKNAAHVLLSGELDQYAAAALKNKIDIEVEESGKNNLIMDLTDVNFMDSSGIGLIIGRYKVLRPLGGGVAVCGANPGVRRVIELSGIEKLIPYFSTADEAAKYLERKTAGKE